MKNNLIQINIREVDDLSELTDLEKQLVEKSRQVTDNAYAPYSGFRVGAAILLDSGTIITGSNQENGAYPSGLCAERVAIFSASSLYPGKDMIAIAIAAKSSRTNAFQPVSPCGACRQVMMEYEALQNKPIKMLLSQEQGSILLVEKVEDLLPLAFKGEKLKKF
jgi:cytidine deaminase